jgi:hypothetical protein
METSPADLSSWRSSLQLRRCRRSVLAAYRASNECADHRARRPTDYHRVLDSGGSIREVSNARAYRRCGSTGERAGNAA